MGVGGTYAFRGGIRLSLDAGLRIARYDAASPLFGAVRADDTLTLGADLTHARVQWAGFAPVLGLDYTRRSSNIVLYSYDDLTARVGLTRRF